MRKSGRMIGPYRILATMAIAGAVQGAPGASARLPEAMHSFAIRHVGAIHFPTGCTAMLEYNDDTLIGAFITDPLCLPHGVAARPVPAYERDFHVPAAHRSRIKGR